MKTLTLLRHAKAMSPDGIKDHERPLSPRGHAVAIAVGKATKPPDLVLCSTALRTRETLADLVEAWGESPASRFDAELYLTGPAVLLRRIASAPDAIASLWLIGHNPGLHELALKLATDATGAVDLPSLGEGLPTAARAVFGIDAESWAAIGDARRALIDFARP